MSDPHASNDARLAEEAHRKWRERFPEAADALSKLGPQPSRNDLAEWEKTYPDAVADQVRLTLYSPEVRRKMRLHEARWTPPDP